MVFITIKPTLSGEYVYFYQASNSHKIQVKDGEIEDFVLFLRSKTPWLDEL